MDNLFDFGSNTGGLGNAAISQQALGGGGTSGIDFSDLGQTAGVGGVNIPNIGGAGTSGGLFGGLGGFLGGGGAQAGLGALQSLGGLWSSYQSSKLAKEAIDFQKEAYETNLGDTRQTYNTALEDRIRARYATEGRSGQADAYIEKNSL